MELEIEIDGVKTRITEVSRYRDACKQIEAELTRVFVGFDPAKPDRLLALEPQLVDYYNRYRKAADIVSLWDNAEQSRNNIVEVWKLYREIGDGKAGS
jgi:hypothetical protein